MNKQYLYLETVEEGEGKEMNDFDYDAWFEEIDKLLCHCTNPIKGRVISPVLNNGYVIGDYGTKCKKCKKFISIESN